MGDDTNTYVSRYFMKILKESLALMRTKLFGVDKEGMVAIYGEYHSSRNNGACQRPPSCLVETCNNRISLLLQVSLQKIIIFLRTLKQWRK